MAKIPLVLQFLVKCGSYFLKILLGCHQYSAKIRVHNPALRGGHNIVKASSLMHPQRQWTILYLVAKRKFHLIAVAQMGWAGLDSLKFVGAVLHHAVQQGFYLLLFNIQLLFIGQALVNTAAAYPKMRTGLLRLFYRRRLQYLQCPGFGLSLSVLGDNTLNLLARYGIFHHHPLAVYMQDTLIREFDFLHYSFVNIALFHKISPFCLPHWHFLMVLFCRIIISCNRAHIKPDPKRTATSAAVPTTILLYYPST